MSVVESAPGQEADNVTIDAHRCMQIEAPAERLECFEAQVEAASRAGSRESGSAGNITSLQAREPNRYLITLDNGQMWQQQVGKRFPLRVGLHVRIESSKWGNSQRLYVDGLNGYIQVVRVR
jgi:hypothetical protein